MYSWGKRRSSPRFKNWDKEEVHRGLKTGIKARFTEV
jgi:hypothetical protein